MAGADQWTVGGVARNGEPVMVAILVCAGCGEKAFGTLKDRSATRTEVIQAGWRLVPGLGWLCSGCVDAVPGYTGEDTPSSRTIRNDQTGESTDDPGFPF